MYVKKLFSFWNALCAYMCLLVHMLCLPSFLVKGQYDGVFTKDSTSDLLLLMVCSPAINSVAEMTTCPFLERLLLTVLETPSSFP